MGNFTSIRNWALKTAAAAMCLGGGLTFGLHAQQVTDPSLTNPNYEQQKAANVPQQVRDAGNFRIGSPLLQSSPIGNGNPGTQLPACFIPVDGSYGVCPRNDDGSFGPIALPFTFSLYGTNYTQVWINTNGNLTFTGPLATFSASGFPFNIPMVAPFWADVDTRNISGGAIYYKVNPTNMIVTWNGVGYYNQQVDKRNTFQVVIGTFADPLTGLGQNVCFHYGDMQWTTGSASSGVGGFGGVPATVGINHGNGVNYVQIGRFNQNNSAYDGPGGADDGVNYLDDQCTCFNATNAGNIPPTATNFPSGNTINVPCGQTVNLNLQFIAPEVNQTVSTVVNTGGLCNTTATVTNGVTSTVNLSITGAACNQGTHQITFVATDNGTPAASTTQVLNVVVGNCCTIGASIAGVTNVSCPGGTNGAVNLSYTGANGPVSFLWSNGATTEDLSGVPAGTYSVTVTNGANCTATATATVGTTPDTQAPVALCRPVTVVLNANGQGSITAAQVNNGSTDNCSIANISLNNTSFNCSNVGATASISELFISEYIEGSGNNKCIEIFNGTGAAVNLSGYSIAVYANGASTPTTVTNLSGTVAAGDVYVICNPSATLAFLAQADATSGNMSFNGDDAVVLRKNGNNIDVFGTIGEDPGTAWTGGGNTTLDATLVRNSNIAAGNTASTSGFPSVATEWTGFATNNLSNLGSHSVASGNTVTLTVTDGSGNSSSCTATVTVLDNTAPQAVCQAVTVQLDGNGQGSITAQQVDNGSSDACGVASLSLNNDSFNCSNVGSNNSVVLTVTDVNGNSSTCTAAVTVVDNVAPEAICQSVTVQLDGNGQASISTNDINNGSNDACGIASLSLDNTTFDCGDVVVANLVNELFISEYIEGSGNNKCIEIYNGTGAAVNLSGYSLEMYFNGNTTSANIINLSGTLANGDVYVVCSSLADPGFLALADQTNGSGFFNGDDAIALIHNGNAIDIIGSIGEDPGSAWTVAGNSTINTTLVRKANVLAGNTSNAIGFPALGTEWTAFGTDYIGGLGSHSANTGAPVVTLTVTDVNGNSSTCTAVVTVEDNIAPSITCPADLVLECRRDVPAANTASVTASDNCSIVSVDHIGDSDNGGSGCAGDPWVIVRSYSVTDPSGNSASCSQTITVEATPVIATASDNMIVFPIFQDSACANISVVGSGGCAPYTYAWSNGANTDSQDVCPTTSTTYYVTVTDAQGCSGVDSVKVCAIDITCSGGTNNGQGGNGQGGNGSTNGNGMQHIAICHYPPGNPNNAMTQCLPIPAALAHIGEGHGGDHLGACGSTANRDCEFGSNRVASSAEGMSLQSISLMAYPNPFANSTTIQANFVQDEVASIVVFDMQGRVVAKVFEGQVSSGQTLEVEFQASDIANGMYIARLSTNKGEAKTLRLTVEK